LLLQIARNVTTNEIANSHRYSYLRSGDGRYFNPYDKGIQANCAEFLAKGYTTDVDVPWTSPVDPQMQIPQPISHSHGHNHATPSANVNGPMGAGFLGSLFGKVHVHSSSCNHEHDNGHAHVDAAKGQGSGPLGLGLGQGLGLALPPKKSSKGVRPSSSGKHV
jgi:hypothetical protein